MENQKLQELFEEIDLLESKGDFGILVSGLSISSLDIKEGYLFCAIVGENMDGHTYINDAIVKGAQVILCEEFPEDIKNNITYIKVSDTKSTLAQVASRFYGDPSSNFKLIGITGTNGKTTIAYLLYSLFLKLGHKAGLVSTIGDKVLENDAKTIRSTPTTPDSISLNKLFNEMREASCEYVFMEVSSHALELGRINGVHFKGGIFTNLTHDHLDFHGSLENYRDAKKKFFDYLPNTAFALSNVDDSEGVDMIKDTQAEKHFYGFKKDAEFNDRIATPLVGDFNQYNTLAVYAGALLLEQDEEKVKNILKDLSGAPGRFESIVSNNNVMGIVDYAHTPDAVENVLHTAREIAKKENKKVIAVMGCGGDRDKTKRPKMAGLGYDMSDILILTSDNPRTENIDDILKDMKSGLPLNLADDKVYIIKDRREAIKRAHSFANTGDIVIILGKGHENYQETNGVREHFSDMEELKKCLLV